MSERVVNYSSPIQTRTADDGFIRCVLRGWAGGRAGERTGGRAGGRVGGRAGGWSAAAAEDEVVLTVTVG